MTMEACRNTCGGVAFVLVISSAPVGKHITYLNWRKVLLKKKNAARHIIVVITL